MGKYTHFLCTSFLALFFKMHGILKNKAHTMTACGCTT